MNSTHLFEDKKQDFFGTPSYLDSYPYSDSEDDLYTDDDEVEEGFTLNSRDKAWVLSALLLLIFSKSFGLGLYSRLHAGGYVYMLECFFHLLIVGVIVWLVVLFRIYVTKSIDKKMRKFPKWKFLLLSFLESFHFYVTLFPYYLLPAPLGIIVDTLLVPINLVNTFILLKYRFNFYHIIGLLIVLCGIIQIVWPGFEFYIDVSGRDPWWYVLVISLLLLSSYLLSLSYVLKERWMKVHDLDIFFVLAWTCLFSFFFRLLGILFTFIPISHFDYVPVKKFPTRFVDSMKCFIGILSSSCYFEWVVYLIYILFHTSSTLFFLYIMKKGTSNQGLVCSLVCIPMSQIILLWNLVNGGLLRVDFSGYHLISFFILGIGTFVFVMYKEKKVPEPKPGKRGKLFLCIQKCCPNFVSKKLLALERQPMKLKIGSFTINVNLFGWMTPQKKRRKEPEYEHEYDEEEEGEDYDEIDSIDYAKQPSKGTWS